MPPLPLVQAAIVVVRRRGKVLVSRRRSGSHLGGCWEFPGGKRGVGESWAACARRELREELGIAVGRLKPLMALRFRYPTRRVYLRVFECELRGGRPRAIGSTALRWARPGELRRLRFPPANAPLLDRLGD